MSPQKARLLKTVRGKDLKIRYTQDNFEDALINQRQFYDASGVILTPITPMFLARQVTTNNPTIARLGNSEPRYVFTCFGSIATDSGESNFKVVIPYCPGDTSHNEHIKEIYNFASLSANLDPKFPLTLQYYGENRNL